MEGHCSTGQSPQWAVVPMEEEEVCLLTMNDCTTDIRCEVILVWSCSKTGKKSSLFQDFRFLLQCCWRFMSSGTRHFGAGEVVREGEGEGEGTRIFCSVGNC